MRPRKSIASYGLTLALASLSSGAMLPPPASAQTATPSWTSTGDLNTPRYDHTATLLANGKVLVAGGNGPGCFTSTRSAELYDPVSGTWSYTGSLNRARVGHTATLLQNAQVLVVGGCGSQDYRSSAELYDPSTGIWRATGSFNTIREAASATLLPNGKVLVVGNSGAEMANVSAAELYDPATETWSNTRAPSLARNTVLLPNGKVLAVDGGSPWDYAELGTELYDPATEQWSPVGYLSLFWAPTVTLLHNGKVLVMGLYGANHPTQALLYEPDTGAWRPTGNLSTYRHYGGYTATLLADGQVLVAGGFDYPSSQPLNAEESFDPNTGTWRLVSRLIEVRSSHTATLLLNGKVLIAGGWNPFVNPDSCDAGIRRSAELYDPGTTSTDNRRPRRRATRP